MTDSSGLTCSLLFAKGNTNANDLAAKNIHIWDGNGSREFLDKLGLSHREVGDLGPVYGFQWRHFGAEYTDMHADYTGKGIDQLADCIDKIKNNPEDRRIVLTAWNPKDLPIMALPPCHMFCQFYVSRHTYAFQSVAKLLLIVAVYRWISKRMNFLASFINAVLTWDSEFRSILQVTLF